MSKEPKFKGQRRAPEISESESERLDKAIEESRAKMGSNAPHRNPRTAIGTLTKRSSMAINSKVDKLETENEKFEKENAELKQRLEAGELAELPTDIVEFSSMANRSEEQLEGHPDFEELVESIKETGQGVPILVRPNPEAPEKYLVVYGHRRLRACIKAEVPVLAIIRELDEAEAAYLMSVENGLRSDIPIYGLYEFWMEWFKRGYVSNNTELVAKSGYKKTYVYEVLEIKKIPTEILSKILSKNSITKRQWRGLRKAFERLSPLKANEIILYQGDLTFDSLMIMISDGAGKEIKNVTNYISGSVVGTIKGNVINIRVKDKALMTKIKSLLDENTN